MDREQLSAGQCGTDNTYSGHQGQHQRLSAVCANKQLLNMSPGGGSTCKTEHLSRPYDVGGHNSQSCCTNVTGLRACMWRHPVTGSLFGQLSLRSVLVVFCAELVGTALVLFVGCMSTITGVAGASQVPSSLQTGLVFGMAIASVTQVINHISRAHLNPAVTFCAVLRGDVTITLAVIYVTAQVVGATIGFGFLKVVMPASLECDCTTSPSPGVSLLQALLVEAVSTSVLVLMCHASWDPLNSHNSDSTPLKFGCYITVISAAAGPFTGASMNPARSVAPAIWTGVWTAHWVYWVGPLLGSALASLLYLAVFQECKLVLHGDKHRGDAAGGLETLPRWRRSSTSSDTHVDNATKLKCSAC